MKPTPRKTGERVTRSQGPAVLLKDLSEVKSPQKTSRSTRSTKGKLEAEQMEPQEEPTETVMPSLRSSKRKSVCSSTIEEPKSLRKQPSRKTRSMSVVTCDEDLITEDSDNGSAVAEDETSNNLENDEISESLNQKTKAKTPAKKSDVAKDSAVENVSVSNDEGHVDALPEEDDSVDVRLPVLRSSRRLASIGGTDSVTDKPVTRKTRSSASAAVEVSELKSIVESLAEKVAMSKESPVLDSPLDVHKEKTKASEEEPEIQMIENPEKVGEKKETVTPGKSKSNEIDLVSGGEDGKDGIKRLQEHETSLADVASENSTEALVESKKSRTPKKSINESVPENEISLSAKSPTGNLSAKSTPNKSAKSTPNKSAEKPKSRNEADSEVREVGEEEIISFISSCRQGLTESSEKAISEEIKLPEPTPAVETMKADQDLELVQTERTAEESSDVILVLEDSCEEVEHLKSSKTKLESPKKRKKDIEKSPSSKLLPKTDILIFDTPESSPEVAIIEALSQKTTDVSELETPLTVIDTEESLKTPKSTRKNVAEENSAEEIKLPKSPKSVKKSSKENQLTPLAQKDENNDEDSEDKHVLESVNSGEAKTPKKLNAEIPSVESSAEEAKLSKTPKSVKKSSKEKQLTPQPQKYENNDEDKHVLESVNSGEAKTPQKLKAKTPSVESSAEEVELSKTPKSVKKSSKKKQLTPLAQEDVLLVSDESDSEDSEDKHVSESVNSEETKSSKKSKETPQKLKAKLPLAEDEISEKANMESDLFEVVAFDVSEETAEMQLMEDRKLTDLEEDTNCDSSPVFTKVKSPKAVSKEPSLTGEVNRPSLLTDGGMGDKLDIINANVGADDISFVPISKDLLKKKSKKSKRSENIEISTKTSGISDQDEAVLKNVKKLIESDTSEEAYLRKLELKKLLKKLKKKAVLDTLGEKESSENEDKSKKKSKKKNKENVEVTDEKKESSENEDKPKKKSKKKNKENVEVTDEIAETVEVEEQVKDKKIKKKAVETLELTEETIEEVHEEQVKRNKKKKKKSKETAELTEETGLKKRKLVEDSENVESTKVKSKKIRNVAMENDVEAETIEELNEEQVKRDKKKKGKSKGASELTEKTGSKKRKLVENSENVVSSKVKKSKDVQSGAAEDNTEDDTEVTRKKSRKQKSETDEVKKPGVIITSSLPPSTDSGEIQNLFLEENIRLLSMRKKNTKNEILIKDADQIGAAVSLLSTKYFGSSVCIDKWYPNPKWDITDDDGLLFSQVYVNRIPPHATKADILSLFPKALNCDLPQTKDTYVNKGFCYLTFPNRTVAHEHIALTGKVNLFGYKLGIYARKIDHMHGIYCNSLKDMLVHITDLDSVLIVDVPSDLNDLELPRLFPSVLHINRKSKKEGKEIKSCAVVICKDAEQAEEFLSKDIMFKDQKLSVIRATSRLLNTASKTDTLSYKAPSAYQRSTLVLVDLPAKTNTQDIINVFPSCVLVKVVSKRRYALVGFSTRKEMLKIYRNKRRTYMIRDQQINLKPYKEKVVIPKSIKKEKDFSRLLHVRGFPRTTKTADLRKIFKKSKISIRKNNSVPYAVVRCENEEIARKYLAKNFVVGGKILKLTYLGNLLKQIKCKAELDLM